MGKYARLVIVPNREEQLDHVRMAMRHFAENFGLTFVISVEDTEPELVDTGETMNKVFGALRRAGLNDEQAIEAVSDMQNEGIYFREVRRSTTVVKTPEEPLEKD
jgi:hypothetical protein